MQGRDVLTGEVVEDVVLFSPRIVPVMKSPESSDSSVTKTEQSYIPPDQQVRDMEQAGVFLNEVRAARFAADPGPFEAEEEEFLDPTRAPGVDIVDVVRLAHATGLRLREQDAKAREAREAAIAAERQKAFDDAVALALAAKAAGTSTQS